MKFLLYVIVLVSVLAPNLVHSLQGDSKKLLQTSKTWKVFSAIQNQRRIYYINYSSIDPALKKADNKEQSTNQSDITITCISKKIDEVMLTSKFPHTSYPNIIIDNQKISNLSVTEEKFAWASNISTDKKIIANMKKGRWLVVETNHQDKIIKDKFSLLGFSQAYETMKRLCSSAY